MEQSEFKGLKTWLVSRMLKAGDRMLYGKRLPGLLDEMSGGTAPPVEYACMTPVPGPIKPILGGVTR